MPDRRARDEEDDYEDDRPRRRRREDEDDEPRARRRDDRGDEDYDDEPRPRRRRGLPPEKLRAIAVRQKVIIFCILANLVSYAAMFLVPQELRFIMIVPVLIVGVTATVFVFLLAVEVHGAGMGIVFGFLTLLPCIGLIALLIVNQQATSLLQKNGVHVGLLGARMSDVP